MLKKNLNTRAKVLPFFLSWFLVTSISAFLNSNVKALMLKLHFYTHWQDIITQEFHEAFIYYLIYNGFVVLVSSMLIIVFNLFEKKAFWQALIFFSTGSLIVFGLGVVYIWSYPQLILNFFVGSLFFNGLPLFFFIYFYKFFFRLFGNRNRKGSVL